LPNVSFSVKMIVLWKNEFIYMSAGKTR
jgi:hypothetical protein